MLKFIRNLFKREEETAEPEGWIDPLDPRGDGTLKKGDPLFDLMFGDGITQAVIGNVGPKTSKWEFTSITKKEHDEV